MKNQLTIQQLISCLGTSFLPHPILSEQATSVCNDARKVEKNSLFVAIPGAQLDGHQFIPQAIERGAAVLVVQDSAKVPADFTGLVIPVRDSRQALDKLASFFYGNPGAELFVVGVTGTNGKTSVAYMVEGLLNFVGKPTGVIGTVDHHLLGTVWPSDMTTPDPISVQKRLRQFKDSGAKAVAMEVSSHALDQKRVDSVPFDVAIFTNLTRDHLDYHGDMQNYLNAKQRLFTDLLQKSEKAKTFAIINTADPAGEKLSVATRAQKWTYGSPNADFQHRILEVDFTFTRFHLKSPAGEAEFYLPMSGEHNVQNAVAAIATGLTAGLSLSDCAAALKTFAGVPGRLQAVEGDFDLSVFVDFAHSPDALENVLKAVRAVRSSLKSQAKIWTVFGCGGDRDKGKRPLMAQAALRFSDHVVITSDNPRTEEPKDIISDILAGVQGSDKHRVLMEADRRRAIELAISKAHPGDVILIAGKGHEDYQILGTTKTPFSDFQVAEEFLQSLRKRGKK